ncbi:MAG: HD domain-containing protein [Bacteroidota bacterium]
MHFAEAEKYILTRLKDELDIHLSYHSINHTIDVYEKAIEIAQLEGITNPEDLIILQTAALYHDAGFISNYQNHEQVSIEMAQTTLAQFAYSAAAIDSICTLIEATRIPQKPSNKLAEILADADLDYLGRDDYYSIADTLFQEFKHHSIITSEQQWLKIQISFLENHNYFTQTSITRRTANKLKKLEELKKQSNDSF